MGRVFKFQIYEYELEIFGGFGSYDFCGLNEGAGTVRGAGAWSATAGRES